MRHLFFAMALMPLLFISNPLFSEESSTVRYSGGMLAFQPGYTFTENSFQSIRDQSSSIGGILRLYFFDHLTAGITGGAQKTGYETAGSENSYLNLGYGGPFVGYTTTTGKIRWCASAFAGMGSVRNLHIEHQEEEVLGEAYLFRHSAFLYAPMVSVDYALTRKISLTAQALCLMGSFGPSLKICNPTLQLGILFSR